MSRHSYVGASRRDFSRGQLERVQAVQQMMVFDMTNKAVQDAEPARHGR